MNGFAQPLERSVCDLADYYTTYVQSKSQAVENSGEAIALARDLHRISCGASNALDVIMNLEINKRIIRRHRDLLNAHADIERRLDKWSETVNEWDPDTIEAKELGEAMKHDAETIFRISALVKDEKAQKLLFINNPFLSIHADLEGLTEILMEYTDLDAIESLPSVFLEPQRKFVKEFIGQYHLLVRHLMRNAWSDEQNKRYRAAEQTMPPQQFRTHAKRRFAAAQENNVKRADELKALVRLYITAWQARSGVRVAVRDEFPGSRARFLLTNAQMELGDLAKKLEESS